MGYFDTFIRVAPDCPTKVAVVPAAKGDKKSVAVLEFELLSGKSYFYTQEELQFAVHVRHKAIPETEQASRRRELWAAFFSKPRACLRASPLPKTYGWGIHFNAEGKIAIYPVESQEYQRYAESRDVKQLLAMRSRRP